MPKLDSKLNKLFGERVRAVRTELRISQDELAHRADLHRTYIGAVERCERNVTLGTVERIAKALKVKPQVLLNDE